MKIRDEEAFRKLLPECRARIRIAANFCNFTWDITSSYREGDPLSHGTGLAVDIACISDWRRWHIVEALRHCGFCRIGIYDKRVHVDICKTNYPQKVLWWGKSE